MAFSRIPDVFPVLEAPGLVLREMTEDDLPAWFVRLSDPEAAALAGDPLATSMQDVVEGLGYHRNAFRTKEALRWAIVPESVGASVGSIGIVRFDEANLSGEIGTAIGRAHWGQGLATGTTRLVVDYAFGVLGLERIEAEALAANARSVRVLEKLGFTREGLLRGYRIVDGARADFVIYGLLRSDWPGTATPGGGAG